MSQTKQDHFLTEVTQRGVINMTNEEFNLYNLCPEDSCDCGLNHMPEFSDRELEEMELMER